MKNQNDDNNQQDSFVQYKLFRTNSSNIFSSTDNRIGMSEQTQNLLKTVLGSGLLPIADSVEIIDHGSNLKTPGTKYTLKK